MRDHVEEGVGTGENSGTTAFVSEDPVRRSLGGRGVDGVAPSREARVAALRQLLQMSVA